MSTPDTTTPTRFRILSLDGGGVKGAYTASVLATIEEWAGKPLVDHFDLIAGTSTGGIIALGLGLGLPAAQILDFYVRRGPEIFPSTGVITRLRQRARRILKPKHSADALEDALREVFAARALGESKSRLVIPSYDAVAGDIHVFKTAHDARFRQDYRRSAVEVARATSAAPTYLPMFRSSWGQQFLDGGVWVNCPSTSAILEAIGVLGVPLDRIDVLSIGTTTAPFCIAPQAQKGGLMHYGLGALELVLQAQERGAWAQTLLLTKRRAFRIDRPVGPGLYKLDDATGIEQLVNHGQYDGRHAAPHVAAQFLDVPAAPFEPFYRP